MSISWSFAMSHSDVFEPGSMAPARPASQAVLINAAISKMIGVQVVSNKDILLKAQEKGVKPEMVSAFVSEHGISLASLEWVITPKTLGRRIKNNERLNPGETDRFIRMARLTALAETVFADPEKAKTFLAKPRTRWGGKSGTELMQTDNGGRMVEELLQQLNHGFFA